MISAWSSTCHWGLSLKAPRCPTQGCRCHPGRCPLIMSPETGSVTPCLLPLPFRRSHPPSFPDALSILCNSNCVTPLSNCSFLPCRFHLPDKRVPLSPLPFEGKGKRNKNTIQKEKSVTHRWRVKGEQLWISLPGILTSNYMTISSATDL